MCGYCNDNNGGVGKDGGPPNVLSWVYSPGDSEDARGVRWELWCLELHRFRTYAWPIESTSVTLSQPQHEPIHLETDDQIYYIMNYDDIVHMDIDISVFIPTFSNNCSTLRAEEFVICCNVGAIVEPPVALSCFPGQLAALQAWDDQSQPHRTSSAGQGLPKICCRTLQSA
jgi:hypothetical protein